MRPGFMQHLGRERFVYFIRKREQPGRAGGSPKHDWKAQTCLRTYFSPLESSVLNKALPGLSHLFARCGFPVF